jgi:hypothetical protein
MFLLQSVCVELLALLFARVWNVCVCVCVFESFSVTEPHSLVRPEFLLHTPDPPCVTPFGRIGALFVCV